jgi:ATP-binding cassette subfamily B protein
MYSAEVIYDFFQENPTLVICNLIISIVYPIQDIGLPILYGQVIDAASENGHEAMIKPFVYVAAMLIFIQLTHVVSDLQDAKFTPSIRNFITDDMVKKILDTYETKYKELSIGEIISQIVKIPYHLSSLADKIKNGIIPHILTFMIANIYFFYYDRTLGIGLLIMVATFTSSCLAAPFKCEEISVQADTDANELNEQIDDSLRNLISIYSQDQKKQEIERLKPYEDAFKKSYQNSMKCSIMTRLWVLPIILIFLLVFIYRCYTMISTKQMKIATFVSLFVMLLYVLDCMLLFTESISDLIFDWGVVCGFNDFFEKSKETDNVTQEIVSINNVKIPEKGIYFNDVTFTYTKGKLPILDKFTIHIKPGEKLAIIGDIGSGKSTIEKLVLKLNIPNSGEIYLDGKPYSNITVKELRKHIGYVPQNPLLFNRTVIENIRYGNEKHISEQDVVELIENLGLTGEFTQLESGIHTKVGKHGSRISGGQRQIVTIVRILLSNPEILVLDEPTSSLDEKTKSLMQKLYDQVMVNKTVIMVTHDTTLMKYATRTITMVRGKITGDDTVNRSH